MKTLKPLLLLLALNLVINSLVAQKSVDSTFAKNAAYIGVSSLGLWFTGVINYERYLTQTNLVVPVQWYARGSYGGFATWGADGPLYGLSVQGLTGLKKSHFEFGAGISALFDQLGYKIGVRNANYPYAGYEPEPSRFDYTWFLPSVTLGYRYQKPTGGFVFRTGIASPNGVYIGLGWAF